MQDKIWYSILGLDAEPLFLQDDMLKKNSYAMCKKIKLSVISRGAMLIQGATFIVFEKCFRSYVYSRGYVY
jgi:hypothetical protein